MSHHLFDLRALHARDYETRDGVMVQRAPVTLLTLPLVWPARLTMAPYAPGISDRSLRSWRDIQNRF